MFNSNGYSLADIAAATGNDGRSGGYGDGFMGNGAWWIIILFLFVFCGWGNGNWGNGFDGGMNGGVGSEVQRGFDTASIVTKLDGITNGLSSLGYDQLAQMNGINSNVAAGFAGVNNAICTLGYQNADLINGVNIALMQGQNALATQLADCCCKTQSSMKDIAYQMATDTCAITTAAANNTRDIIDSQNAGTRAILDAIQQGKVEALQDKIEALREKNTQLAFQASQTAQNQYLVDTLRPCPTPAYLVCGGNTYNGSYPGYLPVALSGNCACA